MHSLKQKLDYAQSVTPLTISIGPALRGWMDREQRLATLDSAIARVIADAEAGRTQEIGAVREELQKHFEP